MHQCSISDLVQPQQLRRYVKKCEEDLEQFQAALRHHSSETKGFVENCVESDIRGQTENHSGDHQSSCISLNLKSKAMTVIEKDIDVFKKQEQILLQRCNSAKEHLVQAEEHERLYNELQFLGDADELLDYLSSIENPPINLPFCDIHIRKDEIDSKFRLLENRQIEFYPREKLRAIKDRIQSSPNNSKFVLSGTHGAGKSHILMILACYYMLKEERTIYFNNAKYALSPINWNAKFLFLFYQESRKQGDDQDKNFIKALEELITFVNEETPLEALFIKMNLTGITLKILIDQLYEAEIHKFTEKMALLNNLIVYSTTGNLEIGHIFESENLKFISLHPGLNPKEYNVWIVRNIPTLSIFDENGVKKDVEAIKRIKEMRAVIQYFTGAVPQYLKILHDLTLRGQTITYDLGSYMKVMCNSTEILNMRFGIFDFYSKKGKGKDYWLKQKYSEDCIMNLPLPSRATRYIYLRYFYVFDDLNGTEKDLRGSASCGFARLFLREYMSWPTVTEFQIEYESLQGAYLYSVLGHQIVECQRDILESLGIVCYGSLKIIDVIPVFSPSQIMLVRKDDGNNKPSQKPPIPFYDPDENSHEIAEYDNLFVGDKDDNYDDDDNDDDDDDSMLKIIKEVERVSDIETIVMRKWEERKSYKKLLDQEMTQCSHLASWDKKNEEVIYYKTAKTSFPAVNGIVVTKDKIVGVKYTSNENHCEPYKDFIKILEAIPNLDWKDGTHEIMFSWFITSNCWKGELFQATTFKIDNESAIKINVKEISPHCNKIFIDGCARKRSILPSDNPKLSKRKRGTRTSV